MKRQRFLFVFTLLYLLFSSVSQSLGADPFLEKVRDVVRDYREIAENLAAWCEKNGLKEEAEKTRALILPVAKDKIYIPTFPEEIVSYTVPEEASELVKKWNTDWMKTRKDYAKKLQSFLGPAVRQKRGGLAMQMTLAALHVDPNNETLRNIVGLKLYKNEWRTHWEIRKFKQGFVDHKTFGWINEKYVSRYEAGERFYQGKWISAEEENKIRTDLAVGWKVESEHYILLTNHSLEEGVRVARELEHFYRAWKQLFVRFYASETEFSSMFQGKPSEKEPRLKIIYYKDQQDYIKANIKDIPGIAITGGFFDYDKECCFFFKSDDDAVIRTIYHEATHQLFSCSRVVSTPSSFKHNFWITESVAIYMESYHKENGYYVLGGYDQERLKMAKRNFTKDHSFYIPFDFLVPLNMTIFQACPDLHEIYYQAGGLGYFFMHANDGAYREIFVEYLIDVYTERDTVTTLFELTQKSPEELDKEYFLFLQEAKPSQQL